jgi:hypothetical protein
LLGVIEKRKPVDDDWLEDSAPVRNLIDTAVTLNDIFRPWPRSPLADAYANGSPYAQALAVNARIRQSFGPDPDDASRVLKLAASIQRRRHDGC